MNHATRNSGIPKTIDPTKICQSSVSEHMRGLDFYFDPAALDPSAAAHVSDLLRHAMTSLEERFSN